MLRCFGGAHEAAINALALNADDCVLLTGSYDKTVRLWDVRSHGRDPIQTLPAFRDYSVTSVAAGAHEIVAGSVDGTVRTFDLRRARALTDATGSCLTRDDAHVVSGSEDGTALVWDLVDASVRATLRVHKGAVCSVAPHPKESAVLLTAVLMTGERSAAPPTKRANGEHARYRPACGDTRI